ncbi:MFS transporter [Amycolatopsis bartoniae]|uniref:MFS transporter n=1 Tax=Amycolatopsis bartoniae TaxID=941986 RepID=A0A8H9J5W3_9PSEU|nr:MFS transporter [Amycolatopsis bartoniae]
MALGAFLANMDSSIVAVGLESLRAAFGAELVRIQWVATAYLLGLSAVLPLTPWLTRRLGAGRLWLSALSGFLLTSVACALSPTAEVLIAVRAAQGMTAGILVAAGQTVIGLAVGPERLGRMMGVLGLVVGLAPIAGPSVGGFLLARFGWPSMFWLNLPVGVLALVLAVRFVPRGERQAPPPIDWSGLLLVSLGLPLTVYALTGIGIPQTSHLLDGVLALIGVGALAVFAWRTLHTPRPVLRLRLLARPVPAAASSTLVTAAAGMYGAVLLVPLWFQLQLGAGAAETGLLLVPMGVGTTVTVALAGRLVDRLGGGPVALAGALLVLVSTVPWPWLGPGTPMIAVQVLLVVHGIGLGLSLMPATTAAYASVRASELGDATALANIVLRVGGAAGSALTVIVLAQGGFRAAFGLLAVLAGCAVLAASWLTRAENGRKL